MTEKALGKKELNTKLLALAEEYARLAQEILGENLVSVVLFGSVARGEEKELDELLANTYGHLEAFWQVAQAVAETLPEGNEERRLLHGLLGHRKTLRLEGPDLFSSP